MKTLSLIFILLLLLIAPSTVFAEFRCDISFPETKNCAQIDWIDGPFLDKNNSFELIINKNIIVKSIKIIPWMVMDDGHEHSSRPVKMTAINDLEFHVENAFFMGGMMGNWYLKIQLFDEKSNLLEEVRSPVEFKNQ